MKPMLITSVTGRAIYLDRFSADDVETEALVCGLSKVCRFAGQLEEFYSVAQHSLLVANLVDPHYYLPALLHDGSEAYLGDMSSKLKHTPLMAGFRRLEKKIQREVYKAFGISEIMRCEYQHIKAADDLASVYERVIIRDRRLWRGGEDVLDAIAQEFISGDRLETILGMMDRLPRPWMAWDHELARNAFGLALRRAV